MRPIPRALCWAGALILLAVGNATGLVADKVANTLFVVFPAVWVARQGRCIWPRAKA